MDDGLSSDGEGESDTEEVEAGESVLLDPFSSSPLPPTPVALESHPSSGLLTQSQSEPLERHKLHRPLSASFIPKFHRRHSSTPTSQDSGTASDTTSIPSLGTPNSDACALKVRKKRFRKSWSAKNTEYNLSAGNNILGIVLLEVKSAEDLPKLKNCESPISTSSFNL